MNETLQPGTYFLGDASIVLEDKIYNGIYGELYHYENGLFNINNTDFATHSIGTQFDGSNEQQEKLAAMGGEKKENAWGSQIRNYVFQPYTLVKDTRTKVESGNVQAVMDGEIDPFVIAYLKQYG